MDIYCQADVPYTTIPQFLKVVMSLKLIHLIYLFCLIDCLFFMRNVIWWYNIYFPDVKQNNSYDISGPLAVVHTDSTQAFHMEHHKS